MMELEGRVALVTGGARGIGAATVRLLAGLGARVGFTWVAHEAEARALEREVTPAARAWQADVRDPQAMERFVDEAEAAWGGVDVLVANAGMWKGASIETMSPEEWRESIEVNLTGTYLLCRFGIPALRRRGGGALVVVSSTAGQRGEAGHSHYAAAKGAQISLVKSLAVECAPQVRVNAVAPGWVDTDMSATPLTGPERDTIVGQIPLGRVATADDEARAIAFLASDGARHITGEILNVNGGS